MTRLIRTSALALTALLLAASAASAQALKVGDKAPAFTPGEVIKGDAVTSLETGKIYVVEFWATWCGPCIAGIPHLSKLQDEYKDKGVTIIGQNIAERGSEDKIPEFLDKHGSKVSYTLMRDDKSTNEKGLMSTNWFQAAGQNGIPCAMIVDKTGTLAWIGHPGNMDKILKAVVDGTYDPAKIAAEEAVEKAKQAKQADVMKKVVAFAKAKKTADAYAALDEGTLMNPEFASDFAVTKLKVSINTGDMDAFYKDADSIYDSVKEDPKALATLASTLTVEPKVTKRDLKVAKKFAERSVELTKRENAEALSTLARIAFDSGEVDNAIALETEALSKAKEDKATFEKNLTKYKSAQGSGL